MADSNATSLKKLKALIKQNADMQVHGARIDLGSGPNKTPGFIGVDIRAVPGVDVVCDLERFPWPIPDDCASTVITNHVLEHIVPHKVDARVVSLIELLKKKGVITEKEVKDHIGDYDFESTFVRFMDEVWRITKPGGDFVIRVPYAGTVGFYQDPTHVNPLTEATFYYFDPFHQTQLYKIYRPKPWEIVHCFWDTHAIMEVLLRKRRPDKSFMTHVPLTQGLDTPYLAPKKT